MKFTLRKKVLPVIVEFVPLFTATNTDYPVIFLREISLTLLSPLTVGGLTPWYTNGF